MKIKRVVPSAPRNPLEPVPPPARSEDSSFASPLVHINEDALRTSRAVLSSTLLQYQDLNSRGITTSKPTGKAQSSSMQETAYGVAAEDGEELFEGVRRLPPVTSGASAKNGFGGGGGALPPPLLSARYEGGDPDLGWGWGETHRGGVAAIRCSLPVICATLITISLLAILIPVDLVALPIIADVWYESVGMQAAQAAGGILDGITQSAVSPQEMSLQRLGTMLRLADTWCRPHYDEDDDETVPAFQSVDELVAMSITSSSNGSSSGSGGSSSVLADQNVTCSNLTAIVLPLLPWALNETYLSFRQRDIVALQRGSQQNASSSTLHSWLEGVRQNTSSAGGEVLLNTPYATLMATNRFSNSSSSSSGGGQINASSIGNMTLFTYLIEAVHDNDWVVPLMFETLATLTCTPPLLSTDAVISADYLFPGGFLLDVWCQRRFMTLSNGTQTYSDWIGITTIMPLPQNTSTTTAANDNSSHPYALRPDAVVRELIVPLTNLTSLVSWLATRQRVFTVTTTVDDVVNGITADLARLNRISSSASLKYYPCGHGVVVGLYPLCPPLVNQSALYRHVTSSRQFAVETEFPLSSMPNDYNSIDRRFGDGTAYWWLRVGNLGTDENEDEAQSSNVSSPSDLATLSSACKYVSVLVSNPTSTTSSSGNGTTTTAPAVHNIVVCLELTQPQCISDRVALSLWGLNQTQFSFQVPQNTFAVLAMIEKESGLVGVQAWDHGHTLNLPPNVSSRVNRSPPYCYSVMNRHRISLQQQQANDDGGHYFIATSSHLERLDVLHNDTLDDAPFVVPEDVLEALSTFLAFRGWSQQIMTVLVNEIQTVYAMDGPLSKFADSNSNSSSSFDAASIPPNAPVVFRPDENNGGCVATFVTFVAPLNLAFVVILENSDGLGDYETIETYIGYTHAASVIAIVAGCYVFVHWLTKSLFQLKASIKRKEVDDDAAVLAAAEAAAVLDKPLSSASSAASVVVPPSSSSGKARLPSGPLSFISEFSDVAIAFIKVRKLARERVKQLRLASHRRDQRQHDLELDEENEPALPYLHLQTGRSIDSHATDVNDSSLARGPRRSRTEESGERDAEAELALVRTATPIIRPVDDVAHPNDASTESKERTSTKVGKRDAVRKAISLECVSPTSGGDLAPPNMTRHVFAQHAAPHNNANNNSSHHHNPADGEEAHLLPGSPLSGGGLQCNTLEPFPSDVVVLMVVSFPHCRLTKLAHDIPWATTAASAATITTKALLASSFKSQASASSFGGHHQYNSATHSPPPSKQHLGKSSAAATISPFEYLGIVLRIIAQHNGVVETICSHQRIVVSFGSTSRQGGEGTSSPPGSKNAPPRSSGGGGAPQSPQQSPPSLRHIQVLGTGIAHNNQTGITTPTMVDPLAPPPPFSSYPQPLPPHSATDTASSPSPGTQPFSSQNTLAAIASEEHLPSGSSWEPPLADEALLCATSIVKAMHDVFFHASHEWVEAQAVHLVHTNIPQESSQLPIVTVTLDASSMFLGTVHLPTLVTTTTTATQQQQQATTSTSVYNNSGGVGGSGSLRPTGGGGAQQQTLLTPSPRHNSNNSHQLIDFDPSKESKSSATRRASHNTTVVTTKPAAEYYLVGDAMDRADGLRQLQLIRHPRCTVVCTDHFRKHLSSYHASQQLSGGDLGAGAAKSPPTFLVSNAAAVAAAQPPFVPIDVLRASLQTVGIPRTDNVVIFAVVDPLCVAVGERKTLSVEREPRAAAETLSRILAVFTPNSPISDVLDALGGGAHMALDLTEKIKSTLDVQTLPRALALHDLLRLLIVAAQAPQAPFDESSASSPPRASFPVGSSLGGHQFHSPPTHTYQSGSSSSSAASSGLLANQRQSILQFVMRTYFPSISKMALSSPSHQRERHSTYRNMSAGLLAAALPSFMYDVAENVLCRLVAPQSSAASTKEPSSSSATTAGGVGRAAGNRNHSSLTANVPALGIGGERVFPTSPLGVHSSTAAQNRFGSVSFASIHYHSDPPTPTAVAHLQHTFASPAITTSVSTSGGAAVPAGLLTHSGSIAMPSIHNPLMYSGSIAMPSGNFTSSGSISAPPMPTHLTSSSSISGPHTNQTGGSSGSATLPGVTTTTAANNAPGSATHILLELSDTPTPLLQAQTLLLASTASTFANPTRHSSSYALYSAKVQRTWENLEGLPVEALQLW